jgi:hypothetical protein
MRLWLKIALLVLISATAWAAPPSGKQIAEKAKATAFDRANSTTGEVGGKKVKLVPADLTKGKKKTDIEGAMKEGQVIGLLETEAEGDETGLPPGEYHLFAIDEGGEIKVYAERDGKVVKEAVRVKKSKRDNPSKKPRFQGKGWCIEVPIFWFFGYTFSILACW